MTGSRSAYNMTNCEMSCFELSDDVDTVALDNEAAVELVYDAAASKEKRLETFPDKVLWVELRE